MLLGVDVGGTFTDAALVGPGSRLHTAKVPSTPARESDAVLEAVRALLASAGVQPDAVERFAHGMTVATNALLEGRGARTALLATEGFTDVVELGRQTRPRLYDLCAANPAPLVSREMRFAVRERMGPDGPLLELERQSAREAVRLLARERPEAVAVCLLHSYADASHELMLGELVRELLGEVQVSLSSELVGTFREYERTATTVLDAALSPLLAEYLSALATGAREAGLCEPLVMQSSGGLTESSRAGAHAALTVLSGPAGGVGGALALAELAGESEVLCFDMGGTSCDVCVIEAGRVRETAERTIAGRPLALPALDIHTVGAGGGSIAWRDAGGALRVGPQSAGAVPGPACYARGGEQPTVTDANLVLGRVLSDAALAGGVALDARAAHDAVASLARSLGLDTLACAEGIVRVAEAEMLGALRLMTVERGVDPRSFALMPFGGAGPLHAAALAQELGIARVLCPRASGVLSALGLAAAAPRRDVSRTVMLAGARGLRDELVGEHRAQLLALAVRALGAPPARVRVRHELRYRGQSFELAVEEELARNPTAVRDESLEAAAAAAGLAAGELCEAFAAAHEERYGYRERSAEVELVNMRVSVWGEAPAIELRAASGPPPTRERRELVLAGEVVQAEVIRGELPAGTALAGPCVCALGEATLLVPPGWSGGVDRHGTIALSRAGAS